MKPQQIAILSIFILSASLWSGQDQSTIPSKKADANRSAKYIETPDLVWMWSLGALPVAICQKFIAPAVFRNQNPIINKLQYTSNIAAIGIYGVTILETVLWAYELGAGN